MILKGRGFALDAPRGQASHALRALSRELHRNSAKILEKVNPPRPRVRNTPKVYPDALHGVSSGLGRFESSQVLFWPLLRQHRSCHVLSWPFSGWSPRPTEALAGVILLFSDSPLATTACVVFFCSPGGASKDASTKRQRSTRPTVHTGQNSADETNTTALLLERSLHGFFYWKINTRHGFASCFCSKRHVTTSQVRQETTGQTHTRVLARATKYWQLPCDQQIQP